MESKYERVDNKPSDIEDIKKLKNLLCKLFSACTDVRRTALHMSEMVEGLAKKELAVRNSNLMSAISARSAEVINKVVAICQSTDEKAVYFEIERSRLDVDYLYCSLINASAASRLLPISGKILSEDRLADLIESKLFGATVGGPDVLSTGRAAERDAYSKVWAAFNGSIRKSGCWINRDHPIFVSSPDAVLITQEGKIRASVEIKTLTTKNKRDILQDIVQLNKGSDLGLRPSKTDPKDIEIRRGSALYSQLQLQILTTGTAYAYVAIFKAATGALWVKRVLRDDDYITSIIDRAKKSFDEITFMASHLVKTEVDTSNSQTFFNKDELLGLGDWLSELAKEPTDYHNIDLFVESPRRLSQHDDSQVP